MIGTTVVKVDINVSYVEGHLENNIQALDGLEPPDDGTQFRDEEVIPRVTLSLLAIFPNLTVNILTGEASNKSKKQVSGKLMEYFVTKNTQLTLI